MWRVNRVLKKVKCKGRCLTLSRHTHLVKHSSWFTNERIKKRSNALGPCATGFQHLAKYLAVLFIYTFSVYAEASGKQTVPAELQLFMTASEQRQLEDKLEQNRSALIEDKNSLLPSETVADKQADAADVVVPNVSHEAPVISPVRYDGIVLRDGQLIDIWINDTRISDLKEYTSSELQLLDATGRLSISHENYSAQLTPGQSFPASYQPVRDVITGKSADLSSEALSQRQSKADAASASLSSTTRADNSEDELTSVAATSDSAE